MTSFREMVMVVHSLVEHVYLSGLCLCHLLERWIHDPAANRRRAAAAHRGPAVDVEVIAIGAAAQARDRGPRDGCRGPRDPRGISAQIRQWIEDGAVRSAGGAQVDVRRVHAIGGEAGDPDDDGMARRPGAEEGNAACGRARPRRQPRRRRGLLYHTPANWGYAFSG